MKKLSLFLLADHQLTTLKKGEGKMKKLSLILTILFAAFLLQKAESQMMPDMVNGWYLAGVVGVIDTTYSSLHDTAIAGRSQLFAVGSQGDLTNRIAIWEKRMATPLLMPEKIIYYSRMNKLEPPSNYSYGGHFFQFVHQDTIHQLPAWAMRTFYLHQWRRWELRLDTIVGSPSNRFFDRIQLGLLGWFIGESLKVRIRVEYLLDELRAIYANGDSILLDSFNGGLVSVREPPNHNQHLTSLEIYPNPFNSSTIIAYHLTNPSLVTVKIYNLLGQEIETLVQEKKGVGEYRVIFNAGNLPTGIYICHLMTNRGVLTKKILIVK